MANEHVERCSASSVIRESQSKSTVRERPLHAHWGGNCQERRKITSIDQDVEKLEPSTLLRGRSLVQPRGELGRGLLRTLKAEPPRDPAAALLSPHSEGPKPGARAGESVRKPAFSAAVLTTATRWQPPEQPVRRRGGRAAACACSPRAGRAPACRRGRLTGEAGTRRRFLARPGSAGRAGRALPSLSLAGVGLGGSRRGVSAR